MFKKLLALLLLCHCADLYAQTIKTDVLVIGNGTSAAAASVQCARSKVKTIWAFETIKLMPNSNAEMYTVNNNTSIPSGAWGEFRKKIQQAYSKKPGYDTSQYAALKFEADTAETVLKRLTDTLKNLSLYDQSTFISIKKDDDRWTVSIKQNEKIITIKARVIIDATDSGTVATKAGAKFETAFKSSSSNTYRTAIASGDAAFDQDDRTDGYPPYPFWSIPMNAVLLKDFENLLVTTKALPAANNIQYLPVQLELGQGAGAMAAYCAFFKTTTKTLKVRIIQGELLDFKGYILPFTDIDPKDAGWRAIQQVSATGMLKGKLNHSKFVFMPDSSVNTAEIQPVLTETYTRAFLWFNKEKPGKVFTIGNTLSLISDYTLTDPELLNKTIQKAWKAQYKFNSDFNIDRPITRREFAVLINHYLNPFARTVDLNGRLVN
jgi:ribosomal protein L11 methylase PrmA